MKLFLNRSVALAGSAGLALALYASADSLAQDVTVLTMLVDNTPEMTTVAEGLAADFTAANPDIRIEIEPRPTGGEGDNMVKTRLATGEMTDLFFYNSGSLFQAINPERNLVDLTDEPWMSDVLDSFKSVVSVDGRVYGAPVNTAMGGGIFYNRKIYAELGLDVPLTWDDFMANSAKIKEAGYVPVIQSFAATWSSQLFFLGDFYNVLQAEPDFPQRYTAGEAKFADDPVASRGFRLQAEVFNAGYLNEDYAAATYDDGVRMVATGEGAHYPMLTFALPQIQTTMPEYINDVGFFAIPGDDADKNGLTIWLPGGIYIPKTTEHVDEAKRFLSFVASPAGCESQIKAVGPIGPFPVLGCSLPDSIPPAVADLQSYFEEQGRTAPALEFLSPIKGPLLEQITVEVGSGIRSPEEGAALYDEDVRKQALQLGLPGWE